MATVRRYPWPYNSDGILVKMPPCSTSLKPASQFIMTKTLTVPRVRRRRHLRLGERAAKWPAASFIIAFLVEVSNRNKRQQIL